MIKKWTKEEEDILIENKYKSIETLSVLLNRKKTSVNNRVRWLKSRGVIPYSYSSRPKIYETFGPDVITFFKRNFSKYGEMFILDKYPNLTKESIRNISSSLGLKRRVPNKKIKRWVDLDRFTNFSPLSCYILGFIWGDGYVSKTGNVMSINNVKADLIQILPYFLFFGNFYFRDRIRKNRQPQLSIVTNDSSFCGFLLKNGYSHKKSGSANKILKLIPGSFHKYWWRGFFDADGGVEFKEDSKGNCQRISLSISSSYNQNWDFLNSLFEKLGIRNYTIYRHKHKGGKGKFSAVRMSERKEIVLFLKFIYNDYDFIGLSRKYIKYIELFNHMNYQKENPYFFV